jgi:hypothetical protein
MVEAFLYSSGSFWELYSDLVTLTITARTPKEGKKGSRNIMTRSKKGRETKNTAVPLVGSAAQAQRTGIIGTTVVVIAQNVTDGHENDIPTACLSSRKIRSRTRTRAWAAVSRHRASASSAHSR